MKSKREGSRRTLGFKMMVFVLTLAFPRETAGATFFHQYDKNGNHSLTCSQSATKYVWYRGRGSPPSLQEFEVVGADQKKSLARQCAVDPPPGYTNQTVHLPAGGVFACAPWTEKRTCPLFSNASQCSTFDFFIVAITNRTEEEMTFGNISEQSVLAIAEKDPFDLTCALQIKNSSPDVALYWLKETAPRICLYSAAIKGYSDGNFSHDVNCCVDPAVKQRRAHHSVGFDGEWLRQNLTVVNASSSDSGTYLCVVATWTRKWVWTIARNVSVEVVNSTSSPGFPTDDGTGERQSYDSPSNALPISLGVIGGVILIGGILGLLYWKKKKAKGNPVEEHPRNQTEMEMEEDDCSPYAVSSRKDLDRNEAMYSVVTFPPETRKVNPTLSDADPASQPGEKVHTVYALLSR